MTPYELVYGQKPAFVVSSFLDTFKVNAMDSLLQNQEATSATLRENLVMAQNRMKQHIDQHFSKHAFEGDRVFLSSPTL